MAVKTKKQVAKKVTKKVVSKNVKKGVEIGAGVLAGAAALAAGYYFYASKNAKNHRKLAVRWAGGLKKEVLNEAKKIQKMGKEPMAKAIERAAKAYMIGKNIDKNDINAVVKELKANWQTLASEIKGSAMSAKTSAQKTVKKSIQRVASK